MSTFKGGIKIEPHLVEMSNSLIAELGHVMSNITQSLAFCESLNQESYDSHEGLLEKYKDLQFWMSALSQLIYDFDVSIKNLHTAGESIILQEGDINKHNPRLIGTYTRQLFDCFFRCGQLMRQFDVNIHAFAELKYAFKLRNGYITHQTKGFIQASVILFLGKRALPMLWFNPATTGNISFVQYYATQQKKPLEALLFNKEQQAENRAIVLRYKKWGDIPRLDQEIINISGLPPIDQEKLANETCQAVQQMLDKLRKHVEQGVKDKMLVKCALT